MAAAGGSRLACLGDTVTRNRNRIRTWSAGFAATLLVTVSASALHAETSNAELAKEIAELKAQIRAMRGAIVETRAESRKAVRVARKPEAGYVLPPPSPLTAIPTGATPVFVTADKKMQFGALTITPGGFIAAEGIYRTRTETADIASSFANIPFGPQAAIPEQRFTARQSRVAALIEAPITPNYLVSAYGEFDFLGSATSSNSGETNSYVPRVRHLYAALDNNEYGMHVLAGQTFSLVTLNSKGITPRNEVTPPSIDGQYVVGFNWRRDPQIRLTKDFNKKLWLSVSAEAPQTALAGCNSGQNVTTVNGVLVTCGNLGVGGGGNLNTLQQYSFNQVPDIIGKAAYEAQFGNRDVHIEGFGMYRQFTDRATNGTLVTTTNASNRVANGFGVGGGLLAPVLPKRLDFQVSGMLGRGIGTYGSGQFSDTTFNPDGSLKPLREQTLLAGLIAHATPSIDVYGFAGVEQAQANFTTNAAGTAVVSGYGSPFANNSGCFNVDQAESGATAAGTAATIGGANVVASCAGNTKRLWEVTGGVWDKLYKGSFGEVRVGVQYEFIRRELFAGNGASTVAANGFAAPAYAGTPKQNENVVMTSFRYYPFQ